MSAEFAALIPMLGPPVSDCDNGLDKVLMGISNAKSISNPARHLTVGRG
jgi:hypothetical protein